jgi:hypothetical protein
MMLRGNLATRPFYNERLVSGVLVILALIALALTAYNATRLTALSSRRSALRAQIAADEAEVNRVRSEAAAIQGTVDRTALQTLAGSTRLANSLITARTFSWTTFFGFIEDTIPMDVRITAVSPEIEKGEIIVTLLVLGRTAEGIDTFSRALEGTNAFKDLFFTVADKTDDGLFRVTMRAKYTPPALPPAAPPVDGGGQR